VVAIGRLSYAIYLLHWPVISFWRMCVARPLKGVEQVAILTGVLFAAQLLWRFVEKPFRAGSALPNAAAMTAIGCRLRRRCRAGPAAARRSREPADVERAGS
jgi:peptidoglycan/LPS O-acetylase OafA/YrhL